MAVTGMTGVIQYLKNSVLYWLIYIMMRYFVEYSQTYVGKKGGLIR